MNTDRTNCLPDFVRCARDRYDRKCTHVVNAIWDYGQSSGGHEEAAQSVIRQFRHCFFWQAGPAAGDGENFFEKNSGTEWHVCVRIHWAIIARYTARL